MYLDVFIEGVPYGHRKGRGDVTAPTKWTDAVMRATTDIAKVQGPCSVSIFFALTEDKYPTDHPYGPDLDNYLKRLLDALNHTIFSTVPGNDGAIVHLVASKHRVVGDELPGVRIILQELRET